MPAVIRKGVDNSQGHCFNPAPPSSGSGDVYTNDIPSVRAVPTSEGASGPDSYPAHVCPPVVHGMGNAKKGSPNVFVNFQAFHRNGDAIDCGDTASNGSSNVFANSNESAGIIDNNPTFASLSDNSDFAQNNEDDLNLVELAKLPGLTPADRFLAENFDTVEDEAEWSAGGGGVGTGSPVSDGPVGIPPDTTASDTPTTVEESDEEIPPSETPPTVSNPSVNALPANFSWATYEDPDIPGTLMWENFDHFAESFKISERFYVADMTIKPVYKHRFSANYQQPVLTQKQILINMSHHAETVLEPMEDAYPGQWIVTSGWRRKSGGSQHNKGQATDFQFPSLNGSGAKRKYYERAQEIRNTQTYDQMILEWGNNPWIHMSSNPSNHRKSVLTQRAKGSSTFVAGLHLIG